MKPKGIDASAVKAMKGFRLNFRCIRRNARISMKRDLVEYCFSIIKRVFFFCHTLVTLGRRMKVKFMFSCFDYNLLVLNILENRG